MGYHSTCSWGPVRATATAPSICLLQKYSILEPAPHCGKLFNLLLKSHSLFLLLHRQASSSRCLQLLFSWAEMLTECKHILPLVQFYTGKNLPDLMSMCCVGNCIRLRADRDQLASMNVPLYLSFAGHVKTFPPICWPCGDSASLLCTLKRRCRITSSGIRYFSSVLIFCASSACP